MSQTIGIVYNNLHFVNTCHDNLSYQQFYPILTTKRFFTIILLNRGDSMKRELTFAQQVERSITKKYRKKIWNPFVAAVKRYELMKKTCCRYKRTPSCLSCRLKFLTQIFLISPKRLTDIPATCARKCAEDTSIMRRKNAAATKSHSGTTSPT